MEEGRQLGGGIGGSSGNVLLDKHRNLKLDVVEDQTVVGACELVERLQFVKMLNHFCIIIVLCIVFYRIIQSPTQGSLGPRRTCIGSITFFGKPVGLLNLSGFAHAGNISDVRHIYFVKLLQISYIRALSSLSSAPAMDIGLA